MPRKPTIAAVNGPCIGYGLTAALAVAVAANFNYGGSEKFQFEVSTSWIPAIGARYHIGVDGISLPLLVLSAVVTVLAVIYSWDHWDEPRNVRGFLALMLLLATGMNGTFVALDLVLFFIFFELVLLPMYFMIGIWGDSAKRRIPVLGRTVTMRLYAAIKFFIFTLFGSAFMLLGFLALSQVVRSTEGSRWLVPEHLHAPIRQQAVLLEAGRENSAAARFLDN